MKITITQRQSVLALIGLQIFGQLISIISVLIAPPPEQMVILLTSAVGLVVSGALMFAYWHGWDYARHILVALFTLLVPLSLQDPFIKDQLLLIVLAPPVVALIAGGPLWVLLSGVTVFGGLLIRAGGQGIYASPPTYVTYFLLIGGMILGRLAADNAQRLAEANALAAAALERAEHQAQELARQAAELEQRSEQQQRLLDLVATLETPAMVLADGLIFAPIVGHIDSERARTLTSRLLQDVSAQRARHVILDIAGVTLIDTGVAKALLNMVQSLRLLGCDVTISGISSSSALTMVHLGISLDGVATARSPQEPLARYLKEAGQ